MISSPLPTQAKPPAPPPCFGYLRKQVGQAFSLRVFCHVLLAALAAQGALAAEGNSWNPNDLIQPEALAKILRQGNAHPLLIYVGFERLYEATRLPGARFGGPASTRAGVALLRNLLSAIPRDRQVIVYCGCCPWDHCPNIRPAFALLREMKFRDVKALHVATNMHTDWIEKGYPVERP